MKHRYRIYCYINKNGDNIHKAKHKGLLFWGWLKEGGWDWESVATFKTRQQAYDACVADAKARRAASWEVESVEEVTL